MKKSQSGQGLVEYGLILVLVVILVVSAIGFLTGGGKPTEKSSADSVATSTPVPLSGWSGNGVENPVCRTVRAIDLYGPPQYVSRYNYGNIYTIFLLNDMTPVIVEGWAKFQEGRYLYDDTDPHENVPGKYLGEAPCPAGAKNLDQ